jgi:hypothetical protein
MIGTYTVTATSNSSSGSPVVFTATATSGTGIVITLTSGNNQTEAHGSTLSNPFVVLVRDAGGNPVPDAYVTFAISILTLPQAAMGQSLSTTTTTTDSKGYAWSILTLGNKIGSYTVTATAIGLTGSPVTFTSTAIHPAPTLYSVSPNEGGRGSRVTVTIIGMNFFENVTWAGFGSDIIRISQTIVGDTSIVAVITINENAALGGRDVTIRNGIPGGGIATFINGFTVDSLPPSGIETVSGVVPEVFKLYDAYPNPFNPVTTIRYQVPERSMVKLEIYSMQGEFISGLVNGEMGTGCYEVPWSAENVASGVYFCRFSAVPTARPASPSATRGERDLVPTEGRNGQAGPFVQTKKLILLR